MAASYITPAYTQSQLEAMTKTELLALASELNVEGVSGSMLKADIVAAIMAVM